MKKQLPVITLTRTKNSPGHYTYTAIDESGKVLSIRNDSGDRNGRPFIGGLVTKNRNHKFPYSIRHLFTALERIVTTTNDRRCIPFALALLDEQKDAFKNFKPSQPGRERITQIRKDYQIHYSDRFCGVTAATGSGWLIKRKENKSHVGEYDLGCFVTKGGGVPLNPKIDFDDLQQLFDQLDKIDQKRLAIRHAETEQ